MRSFPLFLSSLADPKAKKTKCIQRWVSMVQQPLTLCPSPHPHHLVRTGFSPPQVMKSLFLTSGRAIIYLPKNHHLFILVCIYHDITGALLPLTHMLPQLLLFPALYPHSTTQNCTWMQLSWTPRLSGVDILIPMAYSSQHLKMHKIDSKSCIFLFFVQLRRQQFTAAAR